MKRFLVGLTLALALAAPASADAASAKVTKQVHTLLNAPEHIPEAAEWKKLGPEAAEVLRAVAMDGKTLVVKRGRAAAALQHFAGSENKQVLLSLVSDSKAYWLLRGKAARSLALGYGAAALPHIQPLLGHKTARLREAAIKSIGLVQSAQSRSMLQERLKHETSDHLKTLISQTITRLAKKESK